MRANHRRPPCRPASGIGEIARPTEPLAMNDLALADAGSPARIDRLAAAFAPLARVTSLRYHFAVHPAPDPRGTPP